MARMIPPQLPNDCRSPGEKIIFNSFKKDPGTLNWVVLHSLGVSKHPSMIQGEIDFVVIVPEQGVLCLEIKAGNVKREEGIWRYGTPPFEQTSAKGPFKQASDGMHAIREYIKRTEPSLRSILIFSGVLFTYVDFNEVSSEWHPWQYADRSILSCNPISVCCLNMLVRAHKHIQNSLSGKSWYHPKESRPTKDQVNQLVNILRGDFEYFVRERVHLEETEKEIFRFTEEQFSALDVLEENDRVIFKGPAGTGKTFLAIEAAKRSIAAGHSTLFFCYNRLLGRWLINQVKDFSQSYSGSLITGTLHNILLRLSGLRSVDASDSYFWSKKIPDAVIDRALQGIVKTPLCDTLIIDEAQDLITEDYLDVLDLLIENGLAGGRWVMFGDFERQSIYTRQEMGRDLDLLSIIKRRAPVYFKFPLRINCRNTEPIAVGLELICGLSPGYSRILQGQGKDIDIDFYNNSEEQGSLLKAKLLQLKEDFLPSEIIVLSPKEDKLSAAGMLRRDKDVNLRSLREDEREIGSVRFSTIQAFKGLESPAIILTDIEILTGDRVEALLYIGISRARMRLCILMHERCRAHYLKTVQEGFLHMT